MAQLMPSIASSISGSAPVTHSAAASHTIQAKLRSMRRIQCASGKDARSTSTVVRVSTSAISTGIASLSTAGVSVAINSHWATNTSASASSGNSTPSRMR